MPDLPQVTDVVLAVELQQSNPTTVTASIFKAASNTGNTIDGPKKSWQMGNGIAVLRRDGFASLDAGDEPGVVITRPMVFEGKGKLFVNVDVATGGYARASVVDESGDPIDGFGEDDCVAVTDDKTCAAFHWKSNQTLAALKDRYVRVVFHLHNASLYSFWIK